MPLSNDLISQFVKITKDETKTKKENSVYGTVVEKGDSTFVRFDGSDLVTPVSKTANAKDGDRVTVMIKNHTAIITGNLSSPAARVADLLDAGIDVEAIENLLAGTATIAQLEAVEAKVDSLEATTLTVKQVEAVETVTKKLEAGIVTTDDLEAFEATINKLNANMLTVQNADLRYALIDDLDASEARIDTLSSDLASFKTATSDNFTAVDATITNLKTKYANIDFSNIGEAAIKKFYSTSGIIKNLTVSNGTYTGELVGVKISGDLIKANTIVADRLVIQGTDGLYYRLNTNGMKTEAQQTNQNSLDGSVILAKSITATKIKVTDLVAFGATIGGFVITDDAIHSSAKPSATNATRGVYLDNSGQMAVGDATNYIKCYKDGEAYKLAISANDISLSGASLTATINDLKELEIGGRNVILNSSFTGVSNVNGAVFNSSERSITYASSSLGSAYTFTRSLSEYGLSRIRGRKITISCEYRVNEELVYGTSSPWIGMELYVKRSASIGGESQWLSLMGGKAVSNDSVGSWIHTSKTYNVLDLDFESVLLNIVLRDFTGSVSMRNLKIEFGDKATDWTPAPEDIDANISAASKSATDFMNLTTDGLVIGNLVGSELGKNVLIASDSVKIRTGTNENAIFGADLIELAKNNDSATISMLNGRFKIYYSSDIFEAGLGVYGVTTNGEERLAFQPLNENNNLTLGWGGYNAKANCTNIYGHNINLIAGNDMAFECEDWKINIDGNLFAKASTSEFVELIGLSSDDNTAIGHGGYSAAIGKTNIYGNKIQHIVNTKSGSATYKPYYEAGDSFETEWYGAGFISSGSKVVYFSIPLSKPIIGSTTPNVTVTNATTGKGGLQIRQDANYVFGSSSTEKATPSSYSAKVVGNGNFVQIEATMANTTNAINNAPCGINAFIKITFS